jgi:TP901 family phage tail tape measure protein
VAGRFSVEAVFRAVDKFSRPIQRMESRAMRFSRSLGRAVSGVGRMATGAIGALSRVKVHAAVAAGAVALLAKHIVDVGSDYEQAITNVGAVMLKTRDQITPLDDLAKHLGSTTVFTATQAANGMELLARAGFDTQQTMAAIPGILSAAAASGDDLATSVDNVVGVLKGMRMPAEQASHVADVLTVASTKTNSTIGSLAESMKNVSSVASQLGISLEESVAAVALLQDVGLDASVAGSAAATMLTKLSALGPETTASLKKMGVAFKDANGNALTMAQILEGLAKAAEKSGGNMDQVALFADLVGMRGQKAALNLQDMGKKGKFADLLVELGQVEGATKRMADIKLNTFRGQVTLLTSALDGLSTKLYEAEGGPLRGIVEATTKWIAANEDLLKQDFSDFVDALRPLEKIFMRLAKEGEGLDVSDLISQLKQFVAIFSDSFVETFDGVIGGLETMSDAMAALGMHGGTNDMMGELAKNLGIVAGAAAGAIIVFGKLIGVVAAIGSAIMGGLRSAFGAIISDIGGVVAAFVTTFDNIKAILGAEQMTLLEKMKNIAAEVIRGFVEGIKNGAKLVWDTATGFGKNFLEGVKKSLGISSPSTKMRGLMRQVGKGAELGLDDSLAGVRSAMRRITEIPFLPPANVEAPIFNGPPQLRLIRGVERSFGGEQPQQPESAGVTSAIARPAPQAAPSVQAAAIQRSISETTNRERVELLIKDETGRAQLASKPRTGRVRIKQAASGEF